MLTTNLVPLVPGTSITHVIDIVLIMLVVSYVWYLVSVFYCWLVSRSSNCSVYCYILFKLLGMYGAWVQFFIVGW
jgi:hypothetical protein